MKWNPFSLIEPAGEHTKKRLFPIKAKEWFKLGFVSILSINQNSGGSFNFNLPSSSNDSAQITGNAVQTVNNKLSWPIIGLIASIGLVLGLLISFIRSVFTFIFIDALVIQKTEIKKSWRKNKPEGASVFAFRLVASIIMLAVTALLFLPVIIQIAQYGFTEFFANTGFFTILLTFLPSIILFAIWAIVFTIVMIFFMDFALPEMYRERIGSVKAFKITLRKVRAQKLESFVYLLAKVIFSLCVMIIALVVSIIYAILALILTGILALIIILPAYLVSPVLAIALGIIIGVPYVIFLIYFLFVVLLPLSVFMKYYTLLAYEKLFGKKILK